MDKIEPSKISVCRSIERINWTDGVSNEEVLERIREGRTLYRHS